MKSPLERLEGRVQKALEAIDNIAYRSASPSYPVTPKEVFLIKTALIERVAKVTDTLEAGELETKFRL